jgi:hypothetical protein
MAKLRYAQRLGDKFAQRRKFYLTADDWLASNHAPPARG